MALALGERAWAVVLSDYTLPGYSGLMALEQVRAFDADLPFIIVSGNIGEDVAVAASLIEDAARKVDAGLTTVEEVLRVLGPQ